MTFNLEYIEVSTLIRSAVIALIGFPLLWLITNFATKPLKNHASPHVRMLVRKLIFYGGFIIIIVSLLHEFGFQLSALLGAAGIVGIAVGFAARTSMANLISGIFLLIEHPFVVGDIIEYEDVIGKVENIDLLAVDVRTDDNKLVRIPNEALIKNKLKNRTYFDTRRIEFMVQVADSAHLARAMQATSEILKRNHTLFLTEPPTTIEVYQIIGPVVTIRVRVWVRGNDLNTAIQTFMNEIGDVAQKESLIIAASFNDRA